MKNEEVGGGFFILNSNFELRTSLLLLLLLLVACRQDMYTRYAKRPLGQNFYFSNQNASRPRVPDTVARDQLNQTPITPAVDAVMTPPFPITLQVVQRGQERFDIFCSPCHGVLGNGKGMIPSRGFPPPPDFHSDRLLRAPIGHFVNVITNGYGVMFSYADRVPPSDRWAIASYIRALQVAGPALSNEPTAGETPAATPEAGATP